MTADTGGRWGKLEDVRFRAPDWQPRVWLQSVYLDDRTPYYHARADCPLLTIEDYRAGMFDAVVDEEAAVRLGRWRCWTCTPLEETKQ